MGDAAELVEKVTELVKAVGYWKLLLLTAMVIGYLMYRERAKDRQIRAVVDAKNETIERVAQQNRELRYELFVARGVSAEQAHFLAFGRELGTQPPPPHVQQETRTGDHQ